MCHRHRCKGSASFPVLSRMTQMFSPSKMMPFTRALSSSSIRTVLNVVLFALLALGALPASVAHPSSSRFSGLRTFDVAHLSASDSIARPDAEALVDKADKVRPFIEEADVADRTSLISYAEQNDGPSDDGKDSDESTTEENDPSKTSSGAEEDPKPEDEHHEMDWDEYVRGPLIIIVLITLVSLCLFMMYIYKYKSIRSNQQQPQ